MLGVSALIGYAWFLAILSVLVVGAVAGLFVQTTLGRWAR